MSALIRGQCLLNPKPLTPRPGVVRRAAGVSAEPLRRSRGARESESDIYIYVYMYIYIYIHTERERERERGRTEFDDAVLGDEEVSGLQVSVAHACSG